MFEGRRDARRGWRTNPTRGFRTSDTEERTASAGVSLARPTTARAQRGARCGQSRSQCHVVKRGHEDEQIVRALRFVAEAPRLDPDLRRRESGSGECSRAGIRFDADHGGEHTGETTQQAPGTASRIHGDLAALATHRTRVPEHETRVRVVVRPGVGLVESIESLDDGHRSEVAESSRPPTRDMRMPHGTHRRREPSTQRDSFR